MASHINVPAGYTLQFGEQSRGLTPSETAVLNSLASAWNEFLKLPGGHPDDAIEFKGAIHAAQAIIACRVATRVNPEVWSEFSEPPETAVEIIAI